MYSTCFKHFLILLHSLCLLLLFSFCTLCRWKFHLVVEITFACLTWVFSLRTSLCCESCAFYFPSTTQLFTNWAIIIWVTIFAQFAHVLVYSFHTEEYVVHGYCGKHFSRWSQIYINYGKNLLRNFSAMEFSSLKLVGVHFLGTMFTKPHPARM